MPAATASFDELISVRFEPTGLETKVRDEAPWASMMAASTSSATHGTMTSLPTFSVVVSSLSCNASSRLSWVSPHQRRTNFSNASPRLTGTQRTMRSRRLLPSTRTTTSLALYGLALSGCSCESPALSCPASDRAFAFAFASASAFALANSASNLFGCRISLRPFDVFSCVFATATGSLPNRTAMTRIRARKPVTA